MKIAYVYDNIYPYHIGGVEKRLWELAKRLAQRGHEVTLFAMKYWEGDDIIIKEGVRLWGVCPPQKLYVHGRRSITEPIYFAWKVLPPLLKERFDIIDCQNFPYFPCFSAKLCSVVKRTPLIITWLEVWGDYWFEYLGRKGILGLTVEKLTAKLSNKNIAISERTKRDLQKLGVGDIKVIPCGIDSEKIEGVKPLEEESDVIFAGRLFKENNVDVLIRAVALMRKEIPDVKCIIIGDGPEKQRLEKITKGLKVENNVKFTGFLPDDDDVIAYMKSSKVFLFPTTRNGFGMAALEANACGLPIVAVNHKMNAVCDLITNKNGFICELSEEDIAEKVLLAMDDMNDWKKSCLGFARRYDWNKVASMVEQVYKAKRDLPGG